MQQVLAQQFGSDFTLDPGFAPLMGDLDRDGQEDLVLVARSKDPTLGEADFHYQLIDPYDAYFGYGNPRMTLQFTATNSGPAQFVLVVHGWRNATPKAKFVIINLPFEQLTLSRMTIKKKATTVINSVETGGLASAIYWDGKKYRWEPGYMSQ